MDRQDRHNRAIKFLDDGGDCDDRDDHMETRLKTTPFCLVFSFLGERKFYDGTGQKTVPNKRTCLVIFADKLVLVPMFLFIGNCLFSSDKKF